MSDLTFVILSFEGPDRYCHAGGLGSRIKGLSTAIAGMGFETHLFFVGDPDLPGHEVTGNGKLHLHRWCQWISRHHPAGVYDGEDGKLNDWNSSLPGWMVSEMIGPRIASGGSVVVMAEEWHTAAAIQALHWARVQNGWQDRLHLVWNANNVFGFDRIDWPALRDSAVITTVSRYMKHSLWDYGVDARVVPNGISPAWLAPMDRATSGTLPRVVGKRLTLVKVARWDPDKRWDMAVDAVAYLAALGARPLFLARGGMEDHGRRVIARAEGHGLRLARVSWEGPDVASLAKALRPVMDADMVVLESYLSEEQSRALFRIAHAVLANSGIEPFGLVGLEAMASGGIALVGCTGEDYVTHGHDAISLQTSDPWEIVHQVMGVWNDRDTAQAMRRAARRSAARYTWEAVIRRVLLPFLHELGAPSIPTVAVDAAPEEEEREFQVYPAHPSVVAMAGGRERGLRWRIARRIIRQALTTDAPEKAPTPSPRRLRQAPVTS